MTNLEQEIDCLLDRAIREEMETSETTSRACIPSDATTTAFLIQKQAGIPAALPYIKRLFEKMDPAISVTFFVEEGTYQPPGTTLAEIKGSVQSILITERMVLNLIQHASGIATLTNKYVQRVAGYDCSILDTRRTLPGLRALEKYAMTVGGGVIHRYNLSDRFIIKLNHIRYVKDHQGVNTPITHTHALVRGKYPHQPLEIEIDKVADMEEALATDVDAVILRSLLPDQITKCVNLAKHSDKKIYLDCGQAVTLETIRTYAATGVDGISVGDLFHGAESLDIRLRMT